MTITETTQYWARAGEAKAVLDTRIAASRIRLSLGLSAGTIRTRAGEGSGPDVTWTLAFPDATAHEADLAARAASPEFSAIRTRMGTLTSRFERLIESSADVPAWVHPHHISALNLMPRETEFVSAGRQLKGYLYTPPGPGPFPAIIYNHGSGLDQGSLDIVSPGVAAQFLSWGYAVYFPHRHGYGNSPGPSWRSEVPEPVFSEGYNRELLKRLDRESDDVVAAHDHLRKLDHIDPDRIAVAGSSFGGVNTLFAALKQPRFKAAVEFAGAAMNWDRNPLLAVAMIDAARTLVPPIFFAQARNDYSIRPTIELGEVRKSAGLPVEFKLYPAIGLTPMEGHLLAGRVPALWAADVQRFLGRYL